MITRHALLSITLLAAPLAAQTCDNLADLKLSNTTITSAKTVAAGSFKHASWNAGITARLRILQETAGFLPRRRRDPAIQRFAH